MGYTVRDPGGSGTLNAVPAWNDTPYVSAARTIAPVAGDELRPEVNQGLEAAQNYSNISPLDIARCIADELRTFNQAAENPTRRCWNFQEYSFDIQSANGNATTLLNDDVDSTAVVGQPIRHNVARGMRMGFMMVDVYIGAVPPEAGFISACGAGAGGASTRPPFLEGATVGAIVQQVTLRNVVRDLQVGIGYQLRVGGTDGTASGGVMTDHWRN